jgi:hypothetical protein
VFDPNSSATSEDMRAGMQELLLNTSPEYRKYLEESMGSFAAYNGGLQPWRYSWDLSLVKQIRTIKTQKLEVRADVFNFLNLLNKEWGGFHEVYNTQLYNSVEKFDPDTQSWVYAINKEAGKKRYRVNTPYQVHLGLKYIF